MKPWIKWIALAAVALAIIALARVLPVADKVEALGDFTAGLGWLGPLAFGAAYVVLTLVLVPGSLLTLVAGAAFGIVIGLVTVIISATIAAALSFLIARYLLREQVARFAAASRHWGAVDRAIESGGWRVVALLRLSPAVPFTIANYLFGLTRVRFGAYVASSFVAMLPGAFLYVYLGYAGRESATASGRSGGQWALLAVGLLATIAVTVYVTRLARRALADSPEQKTPVPDVEDAAEDR